MSRINLRNLTWGALFVAIGIIFPILFHSVGAGPVFLPMHIPILLAGFLVGPAVGCVVGFITPILSALLTGMPPLMPPKAQMMMVELAVYGLLAGVLYKTLRQNLMLSLVIAMVGGRIVYGILGAYILPLFGFKAIPVWYPVTGGIISSLPGIILQLIFVPAVVIVVERQISAGRSPGRVPQN